MGAIKSRLDPLNLASLEPSLGQGQPTPEDSRLARGPPQATDTPPAIGVHSGRPARPGPSPKRPSTFNFGPARPSIKFGPCRAGSRADPSAHGPAHISLNEPCYKRAARNKKRPEIKKARNTHFGPEIHIWAPKCKIEPRIHN